MMSISAGIMGGIGAVYVMAKTANYLLEKKWITIT